jgi:hypothetical protein
MDRCRNWVMQMATTPEELLRAQRKARLIARLGATKLNLTVEDVREMRTGRAPPREDARLVPIAPAEGRHRHPPRHIPDWTESS